jgi:PleD family two-component response regulator
LIEQSKIKKNSRIIIFVYSKEDQIKKNNTITMTKKILLVDDEPDVTYTIKNILEDNGFAVDTFNDPILALSISLISLILIMSWIKFY